MSLSWPGWTGSAADRSPWISAGGLVRRSLRVPGATPQRVRDALAGLTVQVGEAPVSLAERFVELTVTADLNR